MTENWYSNKELFEKIDALDSKIDSLQTDLETTRTLIRDYNGLRQKVDDTAGKVNMLMWATPVIVAIIGLVFTGLNFILK